MEQIVLKTYFVESNTSQFVNDEDEDKKYEYSLEIRNLKEEAKDEHYEYGMFKNAMTKIQKNKFQINAPWAI